MYRVLILSSLLFLQGCVATTGLALSSAVGAYQAYIEYQENPKPTLDEIEAKGWAVE